MYKNVDSVLKCEECGSVNSESFNRRGFTGIRCLDCGHESTTKAQFNRNDSVWSSDGTTIITF